PYSILKIVSKINETISSNPAFSIERLKRFQSDQILDISLAIKELEFSPKPYKEALIDFYKNCCLVNKP
ncbi:hypothetical protein DRQ09_10770, partial [candidate division KSB1 bacterium]